MERRPVRVKIIAVLLETLMAILHSLNLEGRRGILQVADKYRRLSGRGFDGRVVRVDCKLDVVRG